MGIPAVPAAIIQTPKTHLVPLFEAEAEVDELEALVVGAPEDVARLQVGVDVALPVEEGQSLQDISGTVLNEPHRVALLASAKKTAQSDEDHTLMLLLKPLKVFFLYKIKNKQKKTVIGRIYCHSTPCMPLIYIF